MKKTLVGMLLLLITATSSCAVTQDPETEVSDPLTGPATKTFPTNDFSANPEDIQVERLEDIGIYRGCRNGCWSGLSIVPAQAINRPRNLACYEETSSDVCEKIVEAINISLAEDQVSLLLDSWSFRTEWLSETVNSLWSRKNLLRASELAVASGIVMGWASEGGRNFEESDSC